MQPWAREVNWPGSGHEPLLVLGRTGPLIDSPTRAAQNGRGVVLQREEGKGNVGKTTDSGKKTTDYGKITLESDCILLEKYLWCHWEDELEGIWINLD